MSELTTPNRLLPDRADRVQRPPVLRSSLTPAEEPREGLPMGDYLRAVRRYAWLVVASVVVSCGIAGYKLSQKLPQYLASTAIRLVDPRVPMSGDLEAGGNTDQLPDWYTDPILSQIQVLKSRMVAGSVVDSLGLRFRPGRPDFPYGVLETVRVTPSARTGDTVAVEFGESGVVAVSGKSRASAPYGIPVEIAGVRAVFSRRPEQLPSERFTVVSREDAVSGVLGGLQARSREMTNVIDIAFLGYDRHLAQRVADATAFSFQHLNADNAQQESRRRRLFIQEQLRSTDSLLMVAQLQLSAFRKSVQAFSPREKFRATTESLTSLKLKREELDQERRLYSQMNQELVNGRDREGAEQLAALAASPQVATNGGFVALYDQLIRYQTLRDSLTTGPWSRASTNPDVVRLDSLIETSRSRLVRAVDSRSTALAAQVRVLDEVMSSDAASISGLPDAEAEEQRLARQVETLQRLADDLLREQQKARIDEAVEAGEVEIVDPALVPTAPMGRGGTKRMLFALIVGLMIGGSGALLLDRLNTALMRREDVEGFLHLPALAIIPRMEPPAATAGKLPMKITALLPKRAGAASPPAPLITVTDLHSAGSQAYRKLRTHLIFSTAGDPLRTLLVTSPAASEGKSTICSNLAVTFAQQNMRVALVDCDLRRSRLHTLFDTPRTPGLAEVLVNHATLDEAMRPTSVEGLDLLPAGTLVPNVSELLGSASMRRTLAELTDRYDLVIVDTPPVLAAADAEILGVQTDAVMMVVRAGQTERQQAQYAVQQLRAIGSRVVGAVLNDPDEKVKGYGRYTYYYDYYSDAKA